MRISELRFVIAACLAATFSAAAAGQDLKGGAALHWTGFYAGIDGGYAGGDRGVAWSGNAATEAIYLSSGAVTRSTPVNPAGFLGGVHAGYDHQFGRYVLGIETDLALGNVDGNDVPSTAGTAKIVDSSNLPLYFINNYSQYQSSAEQTLRSLGTLRGRLGILATDRLLIYGTGGLAYGRASVSGFVANRGIYAEYISASDNALFFIQQYPACSGFCGSGSASRWLVGGAVGAGLEYAFFERWSARFEYIYYDLGRLSVSISDSRFPAQTFNAGALFAGQVVRAGLSYRFD